MGTTALSSVFAALGTLQPRAVGILNRVVTLVSSPNWIIGISGFLTVEHMIVYSLSANVPSMKSIFLQ